VKQHMGKVRPSTRLANGPLLGQETYCVDNFCGSRLATEAGLVHAQEPFGNRLALLSKDALGPAPGLLQHERIVEHGKRLRGPVGYAARADGGEGNGVVESKKDRIQEVPADALIDAAPAVAVEGTRNGWPAAADQERRQVWSHARAVHLSIERAGYREQV